ncbi:MAG: hypothetical protein ACKV2Q_01525 [Planctomycetaceae bacterium]
MKFVVLIPTTDNGGKPFPQSKLIRIIDRFNEQFGGSSVEGPVFGSWKNDRGEIMRDTLLKLSVVTSDDREEEARRMVRRIRRELKQDAMYFEVIRDDGVEFIR